VCRRRRRTSPSTNLIERYETAVRSPAQRQPGARACLPARRAAQGRKRLSVARARPGGLGDADQAQGPWSGPGGPMTHPNDAEIERYKHRSPTSIETKQVIGQFGRQPRGPTPSSCAAPVVFAPRLGAGSGWKETRAASAQTPRSSSDLRYGEGKWVGAGEADDVHPPARSSIPRRPRDDLPAEAGAGPAWRAYKRPGLCAPTMPKSAFLRHGTRRPLRRPRRWPR